MVQSVGATGGVYKDQGRSQRAMMTHVYQLFLVHVPQFQRTIPSTTDFGKIPRDLSVKETLVESVSVARVQPRTSKGITDLFLPLVSSSLSPEIPLRSD